MANEHTTATKIDSKKNVKHYSNVLVYFLLGIYESSINNIEMLTLRGESMVNVLRLN